MVYTLLLSVVIMAEVAAFNTLYCHVSMQIYTLQTSLLLVTHNLKVSNCDHTHFVRPKLYAQATAVQPNDNPTVLHISNTCVHFLTFEA